MIHIKAQFTVSTNQTPSMVASIADTPYLLYGLGEGFLCGLCLLFIASDEGLQLFHLLLSLNA